MSNPSFKALPLAEPLQRALADAGYTEPSPIQAEAIPHLLDGRDVLGSAQTGTGKTAAFALPILHHLITRPERVGNYKVRTLVLTPTRELAIQIGDNFTKYSKYMNLRQALVYGGVSPVPQKRALRSGVDVLVATPGRLLDLYEQECLDLDKVEFFVLDEVDRMLDMGFIHDIRKILAKIPEKRQSLFFSATMAKSLEDLAQSILRNPARINVAPEAQTADKIEQRVCLVSGKNKETLLADLIEEQYQRGGEGKTLVFTRTKHGANRLATNLGNHRIRAEAIHGNKSQAARQRALENFRSGRLDTLIATDVAARGIDVKNVTLVVNYDLPEESESYVHRIGRTARAGESGMAVSFATIDDLGLLHPIEKRIKMTVPLFREHRFHADELEPTYEKRSRLEKPVLQRGRQGGGGGGRGRQGGGSRGPKSGGGRSSSFGNRAPKAASSGPPSFAGRGNRSGRNKKR
jgi:ATP-dependent RNA helicase RhlE